MKNKEEKDRNKGKERRGEEKEKRVTRRRRKKRDLGSRGTELNEQNEKWEGVKRRK